ncbi:hypothetical protein DNI29_05375 [Hymenobacter sediminis]|uniref:hypothetical protein n=1 Tax=Hymenobacter sediminis TaxID=2218621 RepID=UPI000F4F4906|nr:hypothetical protein [Hymenobacter sediminis]RPD50228.1 hypothetical protein DNI29_05375 [Hymenobacter sediminis]
MTAKDLLQKILDYRYLWASSYASDKPATIRLAQINTLLEAFGLTKKHVNPLMQVKYSILGKKQELERSHYLNGLTNLEYVLKGEFLRDRPYEENQELITQALITMREIYPHVPEEHMVRPVNIGWMYNWLLNFRQQVYEVAYPNRGMDEGFSVGLLYGKELGNKLKDLIRDNTECIDNVLWLILDPLKRDIEIEKLIQQYGYQDVNLDSIDLEWRIENY